MLIMSFLMVGTGGGLPSTPAKPLALAEHGMLQCWSPDPTKKTCRVIASYRKTGPATYDNKAIVGLSDQGPITVETHTPVEIRGDAVCGPVRIQDIRTGILRKGKEIVSSADAQPILDRVAAIMAPLDGQETCTRYDASGGKLTAKVSIAGSYRPEHDAEVKWISPSDGYSATPQEFDDREANPLMSVLGRQQTLARTPQPPLSGGA
jgi:hypothetical protein